MTFFQNCVVYIYVDCDLKKCLLLHWSLNLYTGVQKIMVPGTSVKSSKEALRLSRLYPGIIYSTAGKYFLSCRRQSNKTITSIFRYSSTWLEIDNWRTKELVWIWKHCSVIGMRSYRTMRPRLSTWFLRARCTKGNIWETSTFSR